MKFLAQQPAKSWSRPKASPLGNNSYVIRFMDETGFNHRLFGFFDLSNHVFVICFAGYEQNDQYHPSDYEDRLEKCRREVSMDFDGRTTACTWPV